MSNTEGKFTHEVSRGLKLFLSYRRKDGPTTAALLSAQLGSVLPHVEIFTDEGGIASGENFHERIQNEVQSSDGLLALIGPQWETSRLHEPGDFVRFELTKARAADITVVPVLVDGARMPAVEELPQDLSWLTEQQAAEIRGAKDLQADLDGLLAGGIRKIQESKARKDAEAVRRKAAASETQRRSRTRQLRALGLCLACVVAAINVSRSPRAAPWTPLAETPARPALVPVRGGTFTMGSPPDDPFHEDDEPVRRVQVHSFLLGETEVTQAQWQEVMGSNPASFQGAAGGGPHHPIENVSVWDALEYLNRLSAREEYDACYDLSACTSESASLVCPIETLRPRAGCGGYRLPEEQEWEFAARGGVSELRGGAVGPTEPAVDLATDVHYQDNSGGSTQPVKSKAPNPLGLFDMLGNVWEWTGQRGQNQRVVRRGCGWGSGARHCRVSNRGYKPLGIASSSIGFRPARCHTEDR